MKTNSRFLLAAGFSLALAFTFSCSSGGDDESSGGGQGVPFNPNSQIYNEYCDYEDNCHIGEAYKGSGVITIEGIDAGSVKDGIVVDFELPLISIPDESFRDFFSDEYQSSCTSYPKGIKVFKARDISLTDSDGNSRNLYLYAEHDNGKFGEGIYYYYFSKAGKINCNFKNEGTDKDDGITYKYNGIYDIDAKEGWNTIYLHEEWTKGANTESEVEKWSTTNVLTREMKWTITTYQ